MSLRKMEGSQSISESDTAKDEGRPQNPKLLAF